MSQALEIPPPTRTKAQYSDSFKAQARVALELNGGNVYRTAIELGIPRETLDNWAKGEHVNSDVLEIEQGVKGPIADQFERASRLFLERAMDPEAIQKTSAYYAQIAASDAIKSAQLLRGQPTSISGSVMSDDERKLRLAELVAKVSKRRKEASTDDLE